MIGFKASEVTSEDKRLINLFFQIQEKLTLAHESQKEIIWQQIVSAESLYETLRTIILCFREGELTSQHMKYALEDLPEELRAPLINLLN